MRNSDLIVKVARGDKVEDSELISALYEICDDVHSTCDETCPVYALNGGPVNPHKPFVENRGCDCFKNGPRMLNFIRFYGREGIKCR